MIITYQLDATEDITKIIKKCNENYKNKLVLNGITIKSEEYTYIILNFNNNCVNNDFKIYDLPIITENSYSKSCIFMSCTQIHTYINKVNSYFHTQPTLHSLYP